jgi:hypothetical protein
MSLFIVEKRIFHHALEIKLAHRLINECPQTLAFPSHVPRESKDSANGIHLELSFRDVTE